MLDRDVLVPGTADRVLSRLTTFLLSVVLLIAVAVSLGGCRWNGGKSAVGGGQNGNIRGLVENESGVPVAGAQVRLDAGEATSQTDENGWFAFIGVPTGVWQILVAKAISSLRAIWLPRCTFVRRLARWSQRPIPANHIKKASA